MRSGSGIIGMIETSDGLVDMMSRTETEEERLGK